MSLIDDPAERRIGGCDSEDAGNCYRLVGGFAAMNFRNVLIPGFIGDLISRGLFQPPATEQGFIVGLCRRQTFQLIGEPPLIESNLTQIPLKE